MKELSRSGKPEDITEDQNRRKTNGKYETGKKASTKDN